MKVVRVLTYEGPADWLEKQLANSLPDGVQGENGGTIHTDASKDRLSLLGRSALGSITVQTLIDERPSQVPDPAVLEAAIQHPSAASDNYQEV